MNTSNWIILFFIIINSSTFGQEICNDGIDNDGNGFIDCSDSACAMDVDCTTPVTDCTFEGSDFSFTISGSPQAGYIDELPGGLSVAQPRVREHLSSTAETRRGTYPLCGAKRILNGS